jgi:hypothetical protein
MCLSGVCTAQTGYDPSAYSNEGITDGKLKIFNKLDLAITAGTTGIGLELSSPIGNSVQVRAGYDFMPRFQKTMTFQVQMADNDYSRELYETDRDAYNAYMSDRFDRITGKLKELTGLEIDNSIDMIGKPTMNHFKLLVDVFPFKNKHWHFTGGFYYSASSTIAEALNSAHDATAPVGVGIYNNLIGQLHDYGNEENQYGDHNIEYDAEMDQYLLYVDGSGFWFSNTEGLSKTMYSLCSAAYNDEKMGVNMGWKVDENGNKVAYTLFPDKDNTLSAKMKTNRFKPYLGFGYNGSLTKNPEDGLTIGFDCGVLFWGGKPQVITHDGTDLSREVIDLRGQVKDYVNISNKFAVYPVLSLRIAKTLFKK